MRLITTNAIIMALLWCIVLTTVAHLIRRYGRKRSFLSSAVMMMGIMAGIRLMIPIDVPWSVAVGLPEICNPLELWLRRTVIHTGGIRISVRALLVMIWLVGAAVFLIRFFLIYQRTTVALRKSLVPDTALSEKLSGISISRHGKSGKAIQIGRSRRVDTPVSIGLLSKMIVIPDRVYTERELELMVYHEYTHLKQGDLYIKWFLNFICCLFWWFPPVYLIKRDVEQAMEVRCDANVTRGMDNQEKADYMEMLLSAFKGREEDAPRGVTVNAIGSTLAEDVCERFDILSRGGCEEEIYSGGLAAVMFLLLAVSYTVIVQPMFTAPIEEIEDGMSSFELRTDNTIIVHYSDDTWAIRVNGMENPISKEGAQIMINEPLDEGPFNLIEADVSEKPEYEQR